MGKGVLMIYPDLSQSGKVDKTEAHEASYMCGHCPLLGASGPLRIVSLISVYMHCGLGSRTSWHVETHRTRDRG